MNDLIGRIAKEEGLSPGLSEEIAREYGNRGERALAALDERRVKKYLDFYVVESSSKEYVVEDDLCTCGDFLFRGRECWHILAVRLAIASGNVVEEAAWYQDRLKENGTINE
jgi:predicted nucleic acid-binding Zn finger protein